MAAVLCRQNNTRTCFRRDSKQEEERKRLDNQYLILKDACNGAVYNAPLDKDSTYFVLDCGAGTCRWLFDLASQLPPSAILRASDVSTALFPESRPSNVSFTQCSVASLPSGWSDRFDFVHQQLLGNCLTEDDWMQALSEMYRVLSPGGWIELNEIVGLHAGPNTESLWALAVQQYGKNLIDINLVGALPDFLKKFGFVDIRIDRRPLTLYGCSVRQAKARKCALSWLGSAFLDIPRAERNAYNLDIMMKAVEKEWSCTEGSELDYRIVCAQKPLMNS